MPYLPATRWDYSPCTLLRSPLQIHCLVSRSRQTQFVAPPSPHRPSNNHMHSYNLAALFCHSFLGPLLPSACTCSPGPGPDWHFWVTYWKDCFGLDPITGTILQTTPSKKVGYHLGLSPMQPTTPIFAFPLAVPELPSDHSPMSPNLSWNHFRHPCTIPARFISVATSWPLLCHLPRSARLLAGTSPTITPRRNSGLTQSEIPKSMGKIKHAPPRTDVAVYAKIGMQWHRHHIKVHGNVFPPIAKHVPQSISFDMTV